MAKPTHASSFFFFFFIYITESIFLYQNRSCGTGPTTGFFQAKKSHGNVDDSRCNSKISLKQSLAYHVTSKEMIENESKYQPSFMHRPLLTAYVSHRFSIFLAFWMFVTLFSWAILSASLEWRWVVFCGGEWFGFLCHVKVRGGWLFFVRGCYWKADSVITLLGREDDGRSSVCCWSCWNKSPTAAMVWRKSWCWTELKLIVLPGGIKGLVMVKAGCC